jgi:circadian clock protein KaiB
MTHGEPPHDAAEAAPMTHSEPPDDATEEFEPSVARSGEKQYVLRLYVTGSTPRSMQAIAMIKAICEEHLAGRYDLEVIDIYRQPVLAREEQIIAVPTLIRKLPLPLRRLIGDLSDRDRVLLGLDLRRKG